MSEVERSQIINCYVSYEHDEKRESIITLLKYLEKYSFNLIIRNNILQTSNRKIENAIKTSDIFIAIVTKNYCNKESYAEFEYAFNELEKEHIVCIFSSGAHKNEEFKDIYKTMKTLNHVQLEENVLSKNKWTSERLTEILNKLNDLKRQIQVDNKIKMNVKYSLNTPNNYSISKFNETIEPSEFEYGLLGRATILDENRIIFSVLNRKEYFLYSFCSIQKSFQKVADSKSLELEQIDLITSNSRREILIFDNKTFNLNLYDSNFKIIKNYKKLFNLNLSDLCIDEDTNDVYLVSSFNKEYKLLKIEHLTKKVLPITVLNENFKPRFIRVLNYQIFIVNACSIRVHNQEKIETNFGESYLYIYNKSSFRLELKIDLNNYSMCQPWGLIVDKNSNIYTTISKIDDKKCISSEKYLLKLDRFGNVSDAIIQLNEINFLCNDMFLFKNQFVIYKENLIYFYSIND